MTKYQYSKVINVHYNFFSAERGFSSFPYNSLNCSFNTQDSYENILENRNLVKDMICLNDLFFINQIHSNKVFFLKDKKQLSSKLNVDGVVTNLKNIGLSILTADCAPIFFLDLNNDIIAACHAGWRGALYGIIENTKNKMIEMINNHYLLDEKYIKKLSKEHLVGLAKSLDIVFYRGRFRMKPEDATKDNLVNKILIEKKNKPLENPRDALTIEKEAIMSLFGDSVEV